jgi:hypothetical protein
LDDLAIAEKRDDIRLLEEHIARAPGLQPLRDYAEGRAVEKDNVIRAIASLDGAVASTIFNRDNAVSMLGRLLSGVKTAAEGAKDARIFDASESMRKTLREYVRPSGSSAFHADSE